MVSVIYGQTNINWNDLVKNKITLNDADFVYEDSSKVSLVIGNVEGVKPKENGAYAQNINQDQDTPDVRRYNDSLDVSVINVDALSLPGVKAGNYTINTDFKGHIDVTPVTI